MSRAIELTNGFSAIVDDDDYVFLAARCWYAAVTPRIVYAASTECGDAPGCYRTVLMHRLLTEARPGEVVDHKNSDGLDNRRSNLRRCTQQENLRNARPRRNNKSGFKGVSPARGGGFKAEITVSGKKRHLGHFRTAFLAALAYDACATREFGEFAWLNIPIDAGGTEQASSGNMRTRAE